MKFCKDSIKYKSDKLEQVVYYQKDKHTTKKREISSNDQIKDILRYIISLIK